MKEHYCIYTDKFLSLEETSPEHIIPLSLGGCNDFCIQVDKVKNSELGSRIDGKFTNDYLISSLRRHKDLRGHSGKIPKTKWTKTKVKGSNKPLQLIFKGKESWFFDPIKKRRLSDDESKGLKFESTFKFDKDIRMLFTAKLVLSAGYFVYGENFRKFADHESLRKLMNYKLTESKESLEKIPLRLIDPFHEFSEEDKGMKSVYESICIATDVSCVMFMLSSENIIASVGIGGQYIGTVNFKADTSKFPNEKKFRLGHIVGIQNNELRRSSFYKMVELLKQNIDNRENPSP